MTEQSLSSHMGRTSYRRRRREVIFENILAYLFLAPALIAIALVLFYPILSLLRTSFYSPATFFSPSEFIGFENYQSVLDDPIFPSAVKYLLDIRRYTRLVILGITSRSPHRHAGRWLARMLVMFPGAQALWWRSRGASCITRIWV
jgi:ABC-type sugar transport system permease subunit